MINEKLQNFLELIKESCGKLEKFKDISQDEYLQDWELQWKVERGLHQAIQAMIDSSLRIISIENLRKPDEYVGLVDILFEARIIPKEFVEKMKDLIRFRNILVHEYFRIDSNKVYEHLQKDTVILKNFVKYIISYYEQRKDS